MGSVPVAEVEGYLPASLKLDRQDPLKPVIPGFSEKTLKIFSTMQANHEELSTSYAKMNKDISLLKHRNKKWHRATKYEKINKALSLTGIAASAALIINAGLGLSALFLASVGTFRAFTDVSRSKKHLLSFSAHEIKGYEAILKKYLALHQDTLPAKIVNTIDDFRKKAEGQEEEVKAAIKEEIQDLEKALKELNSLSTFYQT